VLVSSLDAPLFVLELPFEKSKFCDENLLMNPALPLLVATLSIFLVSCLGAAPAQNQGFRTLAKGAFGGIQEPTLQVIKDKAAWEKLWAKHAAGLKTVEKPPEIDFSKEMVILVAMGRQNTGGYRIQITRVEPIGGKLHISVLKTTPPPGGMSIQVLTAPFEMVAVPKSDLPPEFVVSSGEKPAK
jgi:hypothetical protein